jgi:hypothetical protein
MAVKPALAMSWDRRGGGGAEGKVSLASYLISAVAAAQIIKWFRRYISQHHAEQAMCT